MASTSDCVCCIPDMDGGERIMTYNYDVNAQEERDMAQHEHATKYADDRIDDRMTRLSPTDFNSVTNALDTGSNAGQHIAACVSLHMAKDLIDSILALVRADVWQELYTEGYEDYGH